MEQVKTSKNSEPPQFSTKYYVIWTVRGGTQLRKIKEEKEEHRVTFSAPTPKEGRL